MAHDQPEAPKEGHLLGLLSLVGFWGPEGTVSRSRGPSPESEAQAEGQKLPHDGACTPPWDPSPLCSRTPRIKMTAQMT